MKALKGDLHFGDTFGSEIFSKVPLKPEITKMASMLSDLRTPGYSTEDESKFPSHADYMAHLRRKNAAKITPPAIKADGLGTVTYEIQAVSIQGNEVEKITIDDSELSQEMDSFLYALAEKFADSKETFLLSGPATLTVKKGEDSASGYSKVPHIGGEDFKPVSAYMGKRGNPIFIFKPVMASGYSFMEMSEKDARAQLVGFKEYLSEIDYYDFMTEYGRRLTKIKDGKAIEAKGEQYSGEFGSW